jgi:hypothetical protein
MKSRQVSGLSGMKIYRIDCIADCDDFSSHSLIIRILTHVVESWNESVPIKVKVLMNDWVFLMHHDMVAEQFETRR